MNCEGFLLREEKGYVSIVITPITSEGQEPVAPSLQKDVNGLLHSQVFLYCSSTAVLMIFEIKLMIP